jgi:hypothetical protein
MFSEKIELNMLYPTERQAIQLFGGIESQAFLAPNLKTLTG